MVRIIFSLLFMFLGNLSFSQDFSHVDIHARNTSSSQANSIEKLASHLTKKFDSDLERVRAIYVWIAENVKYSTNTLNSRILTVEQRLKKQEPEKVLKSKRAVCEGYSNLFEALCEAAGLDALVVSGYTKLPNGKVAPVGHAWNLVKVGNKWNILDVTWGAGGVSASNGKYVKSLSDEFFLPPPIEFIRHHFPHDPLFQLLEKPVEFNTFKRSDDITAFSGSDLLEISEKISAYYALSKAERLLATSKRSIEFDPNNGFANFTLSKHHYEQALAYYQLFYEDSQKAFNKKAPLTSQMVNAWESNLKEYKSQLKIAEKYLGNIRRDDPVSEAARLSKDAISQAWKISKETDKQLVEYRKYLIRTGR